MNIFVLDYEPTVAARYHCDKHVVKMILETAQILCTAQHRHGARPEDTPYRAAYVNHPCTRWAGDSKSNYLWLVQLGQELGTEYTRRYGKVHKCALVIAQVATPPAAMAAGGLTRFAQAMPDQYKHADAVVAYRAYYQGEKSRFAKWRTAPPKWWEGTRDV
jgi:hypothetical protein